MNEAIKKLFMTEQMGGNREAEGMVERRIDTGIRTTFYELKRILGGMKGKTAPGVDGVTMELIRSMGDEYIYFLVEKFNEIFAGEKIPADWRVGRIAVLPKEGVDNGKLENRRPLTITSIIYRLFMQIFKGRLQEMMENENKIGPWQCGFRRGFRIEDNLFVLTQVKEMAGKLGKNLIGGFIDIKKAYDMVDREQLFDIMISEGIQDAWVELLKDVYTDNEIFIRIGKQESDKFRIDRGLRQRSPASPV